MKNLTIAPERMIAILELVYASLNNDKIISRGICYHINLLEVNSDISLSEYFEVNKWFQTQKPRRGKHFEFTKHVEYKNMSTALWWWYGTLEGREQRLLFLKHLQKEFQKLVA